MKITQSNQIPWIAPGISFAAFCQSRRNWVATIFFMAALWPTVPATANLVDVTYNSPGAQTQGGVYVGPYNFTVDGQYTKLVCDDFVDEIWGGEKFKANVYNFSDVSHTKFAGQAEDDLLAYEQAAWIYEQGLLNPNQWGDIHYALWAVFNPTPVQTSSGWTPGAATWLEAAQHQTFTAIEFNGISIYTPTQLSGPGAPQEFFGGAPIVAPTVAAVPEPGIGILLSVGLLGVIAARRYQQRTVAS